MQAVVPRGGRLVAQRLD